MTRKHAWLVAVTVAVLATALVTAQHVKKGSIATIESQEMLVDWGTGVTEMTGNVKVTIRGDYDATITASSVYVTADVEKAQVLSLEARGPVRVDIDTAPVDGKRSHVTASCTQRATFSEKTMVVVLEGNAHAEISGAGSVVSGVEAAKYDGQSMTIDLNKRTIRTKQATAEIQMAPAAEVPKGNG
jgi:lipopolysaccharide export system protein LptA